MQWPYLEWLRSVNNFIILAAVFLIFYKRLKKQQQHVIQSEKQYRALFESNPNPMWIFDKDTLAFLEVNDAAVARYGYSRGEFLQMKIADIRPKRDLPQLMEIARKESSGYNDVGNWKHIRKSGEIFPVSITSHDVFFNNKYCKMVMATDITRLVQHEKQLQGAYIKEKELHKKLVANYQILEKAELENRLMGQVIDKINNLVMIVKECGSISRVNQAFIDFTGYSREEAIGRNPVELLTGPETNKQTLGCLIETIGRKEFFSGEMINYKKNGEPYWTSISLTPIFDENGIFQFGISVETIITEKKEREQKILAQHAALQRIAWANSHELRRPICSILGLVDLLKDSDDPSERVFCIDALEKSSNELDCMIRKINKKAEKIQLHNLSESA
jgi:PAS domain S-box-containing protein